MKISVFQHVPFEGPGCIVDWVGAWHHEMQIYPLYQEKPPQEMNADLLIVLGGPMSIYDEDKFPWLIDEKKAIKNAIKANKKVLGLCLGGQLIADVLGKKVTKNPEREIGWFPLHLTDFAKKSSVFNFIPDGTQVFHWHGDTFEIPDNAHSLASTDACKNQGFLYKDHVMGLQFHLETTPAAAQALCTQCADEMTLSRYVQRPEQILAIPERFQVINRLMFELLDRFVAL